MLETTKRAAYSIVWVAAIPYRNLQKILNATTWHCLPRCYTHSTKEITMSDRKYTVKMLNPREIELEEVYDPYPEDLDEDYLRELEHTQKRQ